MSATDINTSNQIAKFFVLKSLVWDLGENSPRININKSFNSDRQCPFSKLSYTVILGVKNIPNKWL